MVRFVAGLVVALCLSLPVRAGELDREFDGSATPVEQAVNVAPAAGGLLGSELDAESPTQAWHRRHYHGGSRFYLSIGFGGYRHHHGFYHHHGFHRHYYVPYYSYFYRPYYPVFAYSSFSIGYGGYYPYYWGWHRPYYGYGYYCW
jgi:hypothetical protein